VRRPTLTSEVRDLLDALHDGKLSLDELAERFRQRKWPRRSSPPARTYRELALEQLQDPEPYVPNSYDDVAAAYHLGRLTSEQYAVLTQAMADAQRSEDDGNHDLVELLAHPSRNPTRSWNGRAEEPDGRQRASGWVTA